MLTNRKISLTDKRNWMLGFDKILSKRSWKQRNKKSKAFTVSLRLVKSSDVKSIKRQRIIWRNCLNFTQIKQVRKNNQ